MCRKELKRKKDLMHFGSPFRKDKSLGIEEIVRKYKQIGRIMNRRGLVGRKRNDLTFYAYLNEDISHSQFKNKKNRFFSNSLKVSPVSNATQVKKSNNKFNAMLEEKIHDEHERRNKAKIMLQAVLVQKFTKPTSPSPPPINQFQELSSNKSIAMLGKLPDFLTDPPIRSFSPNRPHRESKLRQKLKKAIKQ